MITFLTGILRHATPLSAVVEVSGVGYEISVPVTTAEKLPDTGSQAKLHTYVAYREDSQTLYGFSTPEERDFFRMLVEKVSGVGPKVALSIMSRLSLPVLRTAIATGDAPLLAKCPGIGKKTAERLVVELRDKMDVVSLSGQSVSRENSGVTTEVVDGNPLPIHDAVLALVALGYKPADADKAVRKAHGKLGNAASAEELIKGALA